MTANRMLMVEMISEILSEWTLIIIVKLKLERVML